MINFDHTLSSVIQNSATLVELHYGLMMMKMFNLSRFNEFSL
jgi:hypothetical protein